MNLSVLDLVTMWDGASASEAIRESVALAQHVERLGYTRYWFAEHHNAPWQASSAPEILIAHVAGATTRMRIGSGGVMLPNHSPLKVVENFRTLEALHPRRIDLGIGRAPGTDGRTALALRRSREALSADDFPEQMAELLAFFTGAFPPGHTFSAITPTPIVETMPEIWILGSSDFGARFAAEHGFGFAFAHHISPDLAVPVLQAYRRTFRPSPLLAKPRSILALAAYCSEDEEQAADVATLLDLLWSRLRRGEIGPPPTLAEARSVRQSSGAEALRQVFGGRHVVGTVEHVAPVLQALAEQAEVDELMVLTMVPDAAARRRSYELLAQAFGLQASG
jgi:luciferase family oxidoreductase group 1